MKFCLFFISITLTIFILVFSEHTYAQCVSVTSNVNDTVCSGDSVDGYSITGIYSDTFVLAGGCDSIRILNLTVIPAEGDAPLSSTFNTGTNNAGGTLPGGSEDLNWQIATGSINAAYSPAIVMTNTSPYYTSPWPDCQWISHLASGAHTGNMDFYYKIEFDLPCSNYCGVSFSANGAFCLNLDFLADNSVDEIYINGVPQSPNLGGIIPVADPYYNVGYQASGMTSVSLCNNWRPGLNTLIVKVSSGQPQEGFLAQASVALPPPPPPVDAHVRISSSGNTDTTLCHSATINMLGQITPDVYATPYFQWQNSNDEGATWNNIGSLTTDSTLSFPFSTSNAPAQYWFRYIVTPSGSGINANCTATTSDTVIVKVDSIETNFLNEPGTLCDTAPVTLTPSSQYAVQYLWSTGETNSSITVQPPGTFWLQITSLYGCTATDTASLNINVLPVQVDLGNDQTICFGDSAIIEAGLNPYIDSYQYQWSPAGSYTSPTQPDIIYYGDSSITLHLQVSTPSGCYYGEDSIHITVFPGFFANVITGDTGYCANSADSIQLNVSGGTSYLWVPGYGLSDSTIGNPLAAPATSTDYKVTVANGSCMDTAHIHIAVYPDAVISLPDSVNIYPGEAYQITPETNCLYFEWFPPSGLNATNIANPIAQPQVRTRYFVTATTEHGCAAQDSIDVLVQGTVIDMPNAFTPGNGINNIFKPAYRGIVKINYFRIFNRWGEKIFETQDINNGWDGTYKGTPQPVGVYVYMINAVTDSGQLFVKQGNVTLLR